jgi:Fur family ferric uptake transcriptional regulator
VSKAEAVRAIAYLRADGRRLTTARRMVIEGLAQTDEHVTADILARWIQHVHPEIHLSTVYRTLDSLCAWGLVTQVHQPHGAAFFHLAGAHEHVVCDTCGHIGDVPASEFDDLVKRLRDHYDFDLDIRHTALIGRCGRHAAEEARRRV